MNRIVIFGEPRPDVVARTVQRWSDHFGQLKNDPAATRFTVAREVLASAASHITWRITLGPPTTVAPGMLLVVVGFVVFGYEIVALPISSGIPGTAGIASVVGGALIVAESHRSHRSVVVRLLWTLVLGGLVATAVDYWVNPLLSSDRLAAIATLVIAGALSPMIRHERSPSWKVWAVGGIGVIAVSISNLYAAFIQGDSAGGQIALALFVIESAAGLGLLHWTNSRRTLTASD